VISTAAPSRVFTYIRVMASPSLRSSIRKVEVSCQDIPSDLIDEDYFASRVFRRGSYHIDPDAITLHSLIHTNIELTWMNMTIGFSSSSICFNSVFSIQAQKHTSGVTVNVLEGLGCDDTTVALGIMIRARLS